MNQQKKCGCGRSPTGFCIGWHGLTEDTYKKAKADYEYQQSLKHDENLRVKNDSSR